MTEMSSSNNVGKINHSQVTKCSLNVTGSRLLSYQKNTWLRTMYYLQIIWQDNRGFWWRSFHVGRTWIKLAVTSSSQFLPVVAHDKVNSVVWLVASLQIQNSNYADVLLDSGLNLFDIMANLCSKLYCEVLLKSGNYIVYLLK